MADEQKIPEPSYSVIVVKDHEWKNVDRSTSMIRNSFVEVKHFGGNKDLRHLTEW